MPFLELMMSNLSMGLYVLAGYGAFVLMAEFLIWRFQPEMDGGVTVYVTDADGKTVERNLAGFEYGNRLYVSSNHWLRHWYHLAKQHSEVQVTREGVRGPYKAVVVTGDERTALSRAYKMGFVLRFVCGFAPSKFLRLEPRTQP